MACIAGDEGDIGLVLWLDLSAGEVDERGRKVDTDYLNAEVEEGQKHVSGAEADVDDADLLWAAVGGYELFRKTGRGAVGGDAEARGNLNRVVSWRVAFNAAQKQSRTSLR